MTVTATWNGQVIAESDRTVVVEGNHYFPPEDVRMELLTRSEASSHCPWKGTAGYFDVDGNPGAAWVYDEPLPAAEEIRGRLAFWKGVEVG